MDFPSGKGFDRKLFLIFTNLGFDFTHSEPLCISYAKIVFMHLLNMGVIENSCLNLAYSKTYFLMNVANSQNVFHFHKKIVPYLIEPFTLLLGNIVNPVNVYAYPFYQRCSMISCGFQLISKVFEMN